jgi:hypothetical protein
MKTRLTTQQAEKAVLDWLLAEVKNGDWGELSFEDEDGAYDYATEKENAILLAARKKVKQDLAQQVKAIKAKIKHITWR